LTNASLSWRFTGSFFLAASAMPATAAAPPSALSGIFSDIQMNYETGDLGGLEIEIHPQERSPYALIVLCEGWCNQAYQVPIKINGRNFDLALSEPYFDKSGKLVGKDRYRVHGRLIGQALIAELRWEFGRESYRLMRRKTRFGLNVANPPNAK
jgi:hypothetical protein